VPKKKILIIFNRYKFFGGEEAAFENEKRFYSKDYIVKTLEFSNDNLFNLIFSIFNPYAFFKTLFTIILFKPDIIYLNNLWYGASNSPVVASFFARKATKKIKLHNFRLSCSKADHYLDNQTCTKCSIKNKRYSYKFKCYKNSLFTTFLINLYSNFQAKLIKSSLIDEVLVLNNLQKEILTKYGIKDKKIKIVKNVLTIRSDYAAEHNKSLKKYFLYVGRLEKEKGLLDLLDTWKSINNKNEILKIIGDGSLREDVKKYANDYNNIEYLGFLDHHLIENEIANSKCLVFPTRLFEGQPTVILEAMKIGIPVIAPNISFFETFDRKSYVSTYKLGDIQSFESLLRNFFDINFYEREKNNWRLFSDDFFKEVD